MPGSVSDSYDPEFGTGENAAAVRDAVQAVGQRVTDIISSGELKNIVQVARGEGGTSCSAIMLNSHSVAMFSEREWQLIRFAINRALETL